MTAEEFIMLINGDISEIEFQYNDEHYMVGRYWEKNGFFSLKGCILRVNRSSFTDK